MLFGEYGIIHEAMGLALPYDLFQGRLVFKNVTQVSSKIIQSNKELRTFGDYLKKLSKEEDFPIEFDFTSLDFDLEQGLFFESTIPQGFGVGSSGSLTAAMYQRYARKKLRIANGVPTREEISDLKKVFARMESHFHGSSSGFDPLICYLNMPLLIKSKQHIEVTQIPDFETNETTNKGAVFLLNTGRPRRTEPLVNLFLEKCKNQDFANACQNQFIPLNNACIETFLANDLEAMFKNLSDLSHFQYKNFQPMIPSLYRPLWKYGLQTDDYYLKLCGAGGGGFILGFTKDFDKVKHHFSQYQVRVVYEI
ncbi:mevalonate kinase [Bernardetia sp.]|uniref:GHMP family kinase ATP-binding protein n=1 Tax=Bernardetia sp. TaxID=1937974 RepID=UPI0025BE62C8|nr:mevalonate kinase [Bernardetia sp.]